MTAAWTGVATVAMLLVLFASPVAAQAANYGTQIAKGDSDHIPVTGGTVASFLNVEAANAVRRLNLGVANDINDDCIIANVDLSAPAPNAVVSNFDIRITPCQGKAVGTLISDADTIEKGAAAVASTAGTRVRFSDINNNGRYDAGDGVYLVVEEIAAIPGAGFQAPDVNGVAPDGYTVRMTPGGGKAAGTIVFASDSDFISYGGAGGAQNLNAGNNRIAWFDADQSAGGVYTSGDAAYLTTGAAAIGAGALFPLNSVRVDAANTNGAYGTQVALGNRDHIPVTGAASRSMEVVGDGVGAIGPVQIMRLEFGVAADINDDCILLNSDLSEPVADVATVTNFDVRMTPCQGKAVGTLISDADTIEKGAAATDPDDAGAASRDRVVFADVNNNGRYDTGDFAYYVRNAAGVATTTLKAPAALGAAGETWTLRLTPASGKAAGTIVFAADSDFTSYAAATLQIAPAGDSAGFVFYDADLTLTFTTGDTMYIVNSIAAPFAAAGALFPINAIRVSAGNAAGAFGTQIVKGNSDHIITTAAVAAPFLNPEAANSIRRLNLGVANDINDDCVIANVDLNPPPANGVVSNFDIRLTPCQGQAAGTLIADADTVEKGAAAVASAVDSRVRFADVNNNGRYDAGDFVYLVVVESGGALPAAGLQAPDVNGVAPDRYTLRLTPGGGKAAGTIVFASDSDFISYGGNAADLNVGNNRIAWFDADQSAGGVFTSGDSPYLTTGAAAIGANALFPLNSVRLGGPAIVAAPTTAPTTTPATTPPTTTPATTPPTTTPATTPPTTTPATTPPTTPAPTSPTTTSPSPGFEAVAIVAGLAAAAILIGARRKKA